MPHLKEIAKFENENDVRFPKDYTDFLININAIEVEENRFSNNDRIVEIDMFYPFDANHELSFQRTFSNLHVDLLERKYISFGRDEGGWQFVLSVQKIDYGKVYLCRYDEALEDGLTFLSETFKSFINGLH
ncbi:MAG: SMI1/KNR4 family protein [Bacteroidota bacterium]